MPARKKKSSARARTSATAAGYQRCFCSLPPMAERVLPASVGPRRAGVILALSNKWVNGTVLHYYFFDKDTDGEEVMFTSGRREFRTWTTGETEKNVVRRAFKMWKEVGVGLEFKEVNSRDEAEIRIGFMRGDGSWSYIGRDILGIGQHERTMNFGWDLTSHPSEIDTALHEIGHTLGFPHEHQNPNAGIVWNEEAVYASLGGPPNNWPRDKTFHNIIRKIPATTVRGSNWDPNSVMHYPFEAGLIKEPTRYQNGLAPAGGLSRWDRDYIKTFYPALRQRDYEPLEPLNAVTLDIAPGQQKNFTVTPDATRNYEIRTFGQSDTVIVLFEEVNGELRYRAGDDDSGEERNAYLKKKLYRGRRYVLRVRLYYADRAGQTAVMLW